MTKKTSKTRKLTPESTKPKIETLPENKIEDPIGDVTDGEAGIASEATLEAGIEAADNEAESEVVVEDGLAPEAESDFTPAPRPPAKLERLQKILAQAGVASRRKAEEMITQGRVQVNGKVVTVLGTKADAAHDHIRVDGKLLQGPERLRYFVLNKPRGFVTTVRDPEGRPTVMQFFEKMRERLYPVGRLDYMSEGLLLVTNDGELANRLTKASSGVEKTYLVKVAGQPTESELNILRGGVAIERGKAGSEQVRTSPARVRQVRQGDNPWYEVVLIEGRNRELRKMFEGIGHFVEKIRRVGYGPLVLDQEPGKMRELTPAELDALHKTAEGKLRTPKSKELRRRNAMDAASLPTVAPRPTSHPRPAKPFASKPVKERNVAGDSRPKKFYARDKSTPFRPAGERFRPAADRPAWKKPAASDHSVNKRPFTPYRQALVRNRNFGTVRPPNLRIEEIQKPERYNATRPGAPSSRSIRPGSSRPFRGEGGIPRSFTTSSGKPRASGSRPGSKPASADRSSSVEWKPGKSSARRYGSVHSGERKTGTRWKPKTRYGGPNKPSAGARSKPRPGSSTKSAYKGKPGGKRPGGKKRG
jgi:23S rRNA pseudouridine2605 synthase